jgi:hypothetical protein
MMPGDLAYYWGAQSGEPDPAKGWWGRFLDRLVWFVDLFRRTKGDPAPDPGHGSPPAPPPPPSDTPPSDTPPAPRSDTPTPPTPPTPPVGT